jgi:hypothetical protein
VPGERPISNSTEWNRHSKDTPEALKTVLTPETCSKLSDILADWNNYLENHVPYFEEAQP